MSLLIVPSPKTKSEIIGDKGNITIAIKRSVYYRKMEEMLLDTNTCLRVSRDPTKKLMTDLRSLLFNWKKKNWIEVHTYRRSLPG